MLISAVPLNNVPAIFRPVANFVAVSAKTAFAGLYIVELTHNQKSNNVDYPIFNIG
jgi:hypothetical protein